MKMLVITSVREDMQLVTDILQKSNIEVFSVSETIGHKASHQDYPLSNWFGRNDLATDALFFFSFTENTKGEEAIKRHPFFLNKIDWNALEERQVKSPFRPRVVSFI